MPSILKSNEINNNRSASDNFEYKGTAVRAWRVETDDNSIDGVQILDNAHLASPDPIALIGAQHPSSGILYCKSRDCKPDGDDGRAWIVTANYDNQFTEDPSERQQNPLERAVKYSLDWAQFSRIVVKDIDDNPILNTVGDEFSEPIEEDDSRPILVAVRNEDAASFDSIVALALDYKDAVNSDEFHGAPPGSLKLGPLKTGEIQFENGVSFYSIRYEFYAHEEPAPGIEGWDRQILNTGSRARPSAGAEPKEIQPPGTIKNLKEDGTISTTLADNHYITAKTLRRRPFGALNL